MGRLIMCNRFSKIIKISKLYVQILASKYVSEDVKDSLFKLAKYINNIKYDDFILTHEYELNDGNINNDEDKMVYESKASRFSKNTLPEPAGKSPVDLCVNNFYNIEFYTKLVNWYLPTCFL